MIELFDSMTDIVEPTTTGSRNVFDFSRKAVHRYPARGLEFVSPGIPEDDSIAAYTYRYHPRPGDVVFDLGAHAGFTTYFFSTMVGDGGRVVAFEPDGTARDALLENIARHGLRNVTVEPLAMSDQTGTAVFNADGSMAAGLLDHAVYTDARKHTRIETVTLADYCARAGVVPAFIKIDIEGSEVAVVRSSLDFLRKHKVHLAIESFHRLKDGTLTYTVLGEPLQSIGYTVESSDRFGQMFTWATPPA